MSDRDGLVPPPKIEWSTIPVLLGRLGWIRTIQLAFRLERMKKEGKPFESLAEPASRAEELSRMQIGPAILLYRELQRWYDAGEALEIARAVILAGGKSFLRRSLGKISISELHRMGEQERVRWGEGITLRFFNARIEFDRFTEDEVSFTARDCLFPGLCEAAGATELAPIFCETDAVYFGQVETNITLERPHTMAGGAENCPFTLRWKEDG